MSDYEIVTRTLNPIKNFKWRFIFKNEVRIDPSYSFSVKPSGKHGMVYTISSSQLPTIQNWLIDNVGERGDKWEWREPRGDSSTLVVRFTEESDATFFSLKFIK